MTETVLLIIIAVAVIVGMLTIAVLKAAGDADRQAEKQYRDDFIIGHELKPVENLEEVEE